MEGTFVPESCGGADQSINISSITIKPDPVYMPGDVTFAFDVTFHDTIPENARLRVSTKLYTRRRRRRDSTLIDSNLN